MSLPELAVKRPITATMLLVSVLVIGGIALVKLPLAYLPSIDVPFVGVVIPYPNSNPSEVEREITKPVEEVLSTLRGMKKLHGESTADGAEFWLEFDWGQELDVVRMQVTEKLEQIESELPSGIGAIRTLSFDTNTMPVIQGRISAEGVDLSTNYPLLESRVLNPIRRVPGVARVDLNGVAPRELYLDLILAKVKEHGVDIGRLARTLQGAGTNLVIGQVDERGMRYTARSLGSFESIEAIGELVINEQGLKLRDIAEINYEEPPIAFGRHLDGSKAVALEVFKESTANTVETVHAVQAVLDEIDRDPLLKGISVFVWEDQAAQITGGISGLRTAGTLGALLAILSLYFFLRRLDSTIIVSLSIPVSIVATCGGLYFMGKSLNILSMMGLMLAVGMLVDNAIVVLESIDQKLKTEPDRRKAALLGAKEVSMAVAASTVTTLIVFLPLVVGASTSLTTWLREVGITISIALVCSLFSSLVLIPLVSAHFLKDKKPRPSRFLLWLEERYAGLLGWTLGHRLLTGVFLVVAFVVGMLPFGLDWVKSGMFSALVNERLYIDYEFTDYTYKSDAERTVTRVEAYLDEHREEFNIASLYSFYAANQAGTVPIMADKSLGDKEIKELRKTIREDLPELAGVKLKFDDSTEEGGSSTYFAVKFYGQDSSVLYGLADEAARRLETLAGIEDISSPKTTGQREIEVKVDREKAARLGMTPRDVSQIFQFTLGGMRLPRFNAGDREVETWLALRIQDRTNLEDLGSIQFETDDGQALTLGDIAAFQVVPRPATIRRENRKVQVAVRAVYEGEDWEATQEEVTDLMDALGMPAGYSWGWNDRIIRQENEDAEMGVNFLLALVLVYLVMASLFESLAQPFAILFSIPFALPGAAWLLAATGTPFNLMAQIGLLILMGIVVNNGIVLLDHMNQLRARGMSDHEAIVQAGRDRMRPILMTAFTTIVGLMPLAVGGVNVSGLLYHPMARTVMGGLMSSVALTLVVLPNISLGVEAVARWLKRIWRQSAARPTAREAGASR